MNLRILKKLSKRAAPLLPLLGVNRQQFRASHARSGENFHHTFIGDRKHWERYGSIDEAPYNRHGLSIEITTRTGRTIIMQPPKVPRKGTIMVRPEGPTRPYLDPRFVNEDAWHVLECIVCQHFNTFNPEKGNYYGARAFPTVTSIFQAADEIIAERMGEAR
ncbi:hypothetical protein IB60_16610 [Brucella abortus LMN1]|uniref:hypothetical protein n=1 Tax=Brucella abortus TaxID=235 RepID=UPI0004E92138|nr:hypothetical protein [Brucella abortus]KFH18605.1 hypothetical protein IB60_16610 [Brucella abortus LMN1]KFH24292.1 hypothetical protein IB61_11585 [Brucella abortus LMN2]RUQ67074.1 hypothetical protein ELZ23_16010 [Brucella abortus]RUQ78132.1 hypothetical protein ELZ22_17395 [Brucella abortus]RUQ88177.1 hypothetical protein ELZ18_16085 [Brucella abortus]